MLLETLIINESEEHNVRGAPNLMDTVLSACPRSIFCLTMKSSHKQLQNQSNPQYLSNKSKILQIYQELLYFVRPKALRHNAVQHQT